METFQWLKIKIEQLISAFFLFQIYPFNICILFCINVYIRYIFNISSYPVKNILTLMKQFNSIQNKSIVSLVANKYF